MNQKKFMIVAGAAVLLLGAGVWLSLHRSSLQTDRGGGSVFADLKPALGEVEEIRLSRGDGSRTTLHRNADGWTVVERQVPGGCRAGARARTGTRRTTRRRTENQRSG